jgi:hypothetical protein
MLVTVPASFTLFSNYKKLLIDMWRIVSLLQDKEIPVALFGTVGTDDVDKKEWSDREN